MRNKIHLKRMVYIVALASISIILALFEIPWFIPSGPFAAFLRLDFSEVVILVSIVTLGYKDTMYVIILRSLVRIAFKGFPIDEMIGEFIALNASFSIMFGFFMASIIIKKKIKPLFLEVPTSHHVLKTYEAIVYVLMISVSLSLYMIVINYTFTTPLLLSYYGIFGSQLHFTLFSFIPDTEAFTFSTFFIAVVISYTPFNLVKAISVTIIFNIIWPRLKYIEY
jgi:riboflavin transporter FmnP